MPVIPPRCFEVICVVLPKDSIEGVSSLSSQKATSGQLLQLLTATMSAASRGNGRVVPRTPKQLAAVATAAGAEAPADGVDLSASDIASVPPSPGLFEATPAPSKHTSTAVREAEQHSNGWRCAAFVQGTTPIATLSPGQLGSSRSRRLLAHNSQLVLLPGLGLATCRLNSQVAAAIAGHSAAKQEQQQEAGEEREGQQQQQELLQVLCSPVEANRFVAADASKNAPGSYFHLRKPETSVLRLSFADWLQSWQTWRRSQLLLQADICTWQLVPGESSHSSSGSDASGASVTAPRAGGAGAGRIRLWPKGVAQHLPQLLHSTAASAASHQAMDAAVVTTATEVAALLDWALLQQLLDDGCWAGAGSLQLLAGGRDALLPARYHTQDRLMCQVAGRQRLLLLPPDQAFRGLYPFPVAHPLDGYSCVDWEEPELAAWPVAAQVRGQVCLLEPGDSLVVPAYWFVHSQLLQPACVALVLELQPLPHKLASPGALLLQLSRMIELWTAAEVGTANVRQTLQALAAGSEWQQLHSKSSLASVNSYKRLRLFSMILQQLQSVLSLQALQPSPAAVPGAAATATDGCPHAAARGGCPCGSSLECAARRVLAAMCEERLMPTDWLNEGIADPLYLQHQPQRFVVREHAEAARYPALFRHRLISNRPDWMQHAERLALPPDSGSSRQRRQHTIALDDQTQ